MKSNEREDVELFWREAVAADYQHFLRKDGLKSHLVEPDGIGKRKIIVDDSGIIATGRIIPLEWDSIFFGFSCAKIDGMYFSQRASREDTRRRLLSEILGDEAAKDAILLSCRIRADDYPLTQELEAEGFRLVDVMTIFNKELNGPGVSKVGDTVLEESDSNIVPLLEECINGMHFGRMFSDPHITIEKAREFYLEVSKHYLSKEASTITVQYEGADAGLAIGVIDDGVSGYLKRRYGYLWFIGLLPEFKGRRLGHELFSLFCQEFSNSCDLLEIGTQIHNYPATRIYESGNCRISSHLLTFHRWNSTPASLDTVVAKNAIANLYGK